MVNDRIEKYDKNPKSWIDLDKAIDEIENDL